MDPMTIVILVLVFFLVALGLLLYTLMVFDHSSRIFEKLYGFPPETMTPNEVKITIREWAHRVSDSPDIYNIEMMEQLLKFARAYNLLTDE